MFGNGQRLLFLQKIMQEVKTMQIDTSNSPSVLQGLAGAVLCHIVAQYSGIVEVLARPNLVEVILKYMLEAMSLTVGATTVFTFYYKYSAKIVRSYLWWMIHIRRFFRKK